jgi:hypothetical protein
VKSGIRIVAVFITIVLFATLTLVAHHSNAAQFDTAKRITMKGEVTKVEWTNPHAYIYVNVKDASGKIVNWSLEGFPPNTLLRTGWSQKDLKVGDVISFEGAASRDGSNIMLGREITLVNGRKLYWGPMQ